jgi:hypothetical protein
MENGNEIRYLLMMMRLDEVISFNFYFLNMMKLVFYYNSNKELNNGKSTWSLFALSSIEDV